MALDAARRRLAAHHGGGGACAFSATAMPQRRGAAGGDEAAEFSLRQGLRELLDRVDRGVGGGYSGGGGGRGRSANRGGGPRGDIMAMQRNSTGENRRSGSAAAVNGERRPQIGDWSCPACGFGPNFARRNRCFQCRHPRSPRGVGGARASGNGGGVLRGPANAEGLRPLLGRGGASSGQGTGTSSANHEPSFRVPGASVAARAAAASTSGTASAGTANRAGLAQGSPTTAHTRVGTAGAAGNAQPNTDVDADGFKMVHRRGWRKSRADADQGDDDAGDGTTRQGAAGLAATPSEDQVGGGAGDGARDDGGGEAPDPNVLHQEWHNEIALVKRLKQQGIDDNHPAMRAACSARDAAEQRWRGAKDPTPASVRLSRAQSKLDKAINMQAETRRAMLELESDYKEKLALLQAKMDEDTDRVQNRRRQLDDVQEELTSEGRGGRARAEQGAAVRKVHGALCNEVAPTIATLIEQLDSSTPAWGMLNGLLSTLTTSKTLLEKAIPTKGAQAFIIADDAVDADDMARDGCDDGVASEWSESHEFRDGGGNAHAHADDDMGVDEGNWWEESHHQWQRSTRWEPTGYGKWARSSWADSWEQEHGQADDGGEQPPAARRRLDDRPSTDGGAAAAATATAAEGAVEAEQRNRQHRERVDAIVRSAIDAGIQPLTSQGEDLQVLDSNALDAWVADNLPEAARR